MIPVAPIAYDLAITHFDEQRTRHPHAPLSRGDGLSRDGSKTFVMGTARHPVDEDMIALGENVQHFEVNVGKGCYEALVVAHSLGLVQGGDTPGSSAM